MLSLIVAHTLVNRVIGKENELLWRIPEDLAFFKSKTLGKIVVMGRKTYESLPKKNKPLLDRKTYILTRDTSYKVDHPDVTVFNDLQKCLMVAQLKCGEVMVAGGQQIYEQCLPYADRVYATILNQSYDGDTFFPQLNPDEWDKSYDHLFASEQLELFYNRIIFDRKKSAPKGANI